MQRLLLLLIGLEQMLLHLLLPLLLLRGLQQKLQLLKRG